MTTLLASTAAKAGAGTLNGDELIRVIDDPSGTPSSKHTTPEALATYARTAGSVVAGTRMGAEGAINLLSASTKYAVPTGCAMTAVFTSGASASEIIWIYYRPVQIEVNSVWSTVAHGA